MPGIWYASDRCGDMYIRSTYIIHKKVSRKYFFQQVVIGGRMYFHCNDIIILLNLQYVSNAKNGATLYKCTVLVDTKKHDLYQLVYPKNAI